jgi:hypothetical protein
MRISRRSKLALGVVAAAGLVAFVFWAYRWLKIDACLDRGGAWDYAAGKCQLHPFHDQMLKCFREDGKWNYRSDTCEKASSE